MSQVLSRRDFVAAGAAGGVAILAPMSISEALAAPRPSRLNLIRSGRFAEGVLSGDPTPNGITLWTRLAGAGGRGLVELEVARTPTFRSVIARTRLVTSANVGHTVKARLTGLRAHEQYYYRFLTRGQNSPVGRFRTALPADSNQTVRFGFFSCQDFTFGFYNAHEVMAREDLDFVVNLGDYVYAEAYHRRGSASGGVRTDPVGEADTLAEYRRKYAAYRSDASLRKMHAKFPMISIWDDHEVQDNYAGGAGASGGLSPEKRFSIARKRAGYRAYFESMPTFGNPGTRIYKAVRFGRNVDLVLMDQRQYRADQPCGDPQVGPPCPELNNPRPFLGATQMNFLKSRLRSTRARWKVLGNQVMVMKTIFPGGNYIGFDSWQGYPGERNELLNHIKNNNIKDVVFVTGDIHTFIAGGVRINDNDAASVATEFVGGSISSQGLGDGGGGLIPGADPFNPMTPPGIIGLLRQSNPWVKEADTDHHGYAVATASASSFTCRFKRMQTVKRRTTAALPTGVFSFRLNRGQTL